MKKARPSSSAILMYCIIAICAILSLIFFWLYYGSGIRNGVVLWFGVVCFTIMYHLWLRIIMGNITKLLKIKHTGLWFREHGFEKKIYNLLRVRAWKDKVPTYNPELFSLRDYSLEDVANTMSKAECDHWINEIISLSTLLFALIWGELWIFAATAVLAMLFDAQFIVIQRYNRPRITKLMQRRRAANE